MSGPALRAVGVHAVWRARRSTGLPLVGVGGIAGGEDAVQYLLAGASLVQVGTASFWDPRSAGRVIKELERFGRRERIAHVSELVGGARMESGGVPSDPGPAVASPPETTGPDLCDG